MIVCHTLSAFLCWIDTWFVGQNFQFSLKQILYLIFQTLKWLCITTIFGALFKKIYTLILPATELGTGEEKMKWS